MASAHRSDGVASAHAMMPRQRPPKHIGRGATWPRTHRGGRASIPEEGGPEHPPLAARLEEVVRPPPDASAGERP